MRVSRRSPPSSSRSSSCCSNDGHNNNDYRGSRTSSSSCGYRSICSDSISSSSPSRSSSSSSTYCTSPKFDSDMSYSAQLSKHSLERIKRHQVMHKLRWMVPSARHAHTQLELLQHVIDYIADLQHELEANNAVMEVADVATVDNGNNVVGKENINVGELSRLFNKMIGTKSRARHQRTTSGETITAATAVSGTTTATGRDL